MEPGNGKRRLPSAYDYPTHPARPAPRGDAPDIPLEQAAAMIASAEGWLGSCAEYLASTVEHLDQLGINDGPMHDLQRRVAARR